MIAVYRKEIRSYLTSMIGYVFVAFMLAVIGIFFLHQAESVLGPV